MRALLCLSYLLVGAVQFFPAHDGLVYWLGLSPLACVLLALPLAFLPLAGSALGAAGTLVAWGWAWWQGGLFLLGGLGLSVLLLALLSMIELMAEGWRAAPPRRERDQPSSSREISRMTSVWSAAPPRASTACAYSSAQAASPGASAPRSRASAVASARSFAMSSMANPEA